MDAPASAEKRHKEGGIVPENLTDLIAELALANRILAHVSIADLTLRVSVDSQGVALWKPVERDVFHDDCARCILVPVCQQLSAATGTALLWRRLGLVDAGGAPTREIKRVTPSDHSSTQS